MIWGAIAVAAIVILFMLTRRLGKKRLGPEP